MKQKIMSLTTIFMLSFSLVASPAAEALNGVSVIAAAKTKKKTAAKKKAKTKKKIKTKKVYYVPGTGHSYHSVKDCSTLSRSKVIKSITVKAAEAKKLRACKVCH